MSDSLDLFVRPDEQCVALTSSFRLIQRYRGHRYSVDDMLVAHLAATLDINPLRALDLGCGLGSVLLMLAWRFPNTKFVGIEAQPEHIALVRRNILLNGCESRALVLAGDLRDENLLATAAGGFDLITGTPPYFDPRSTTICADPQRAHAQWELRGGIEDYVRAASKLLHEDGYFVVCSAARPSERMPRALESEGLFLDRHQDVLPRRDRCPFLSLWVATKRKVEKKTSPPLILRENDGLRTLEHKTIREFFGIPCSLR